jgi:hypothetical protein
MGSVSDEGS